MEHTTTLNGPGTADDTVTAASHVYGLGIDELLESEQWSGPNPPTLYYPLADDQFSIVALWEVRSDDTRSVAQRLSYGDYGNQTVRNANGTIAAVGTAAALRHGYTGRLHDATSGLTEYRHRWMNPAAGTFLQRDPLGYVDAMNLYVYVQNKPLHKTDPNGLSSSCNTSRNSQSGRVNPRADGPCSGGIYCDQTYRGRLSAALADFTLCQKGSVQPVSIWNIWCFVGCVPLLAATPFAYLACAAACNGFVSGKGVDDLRFCSRQLEAAIENARVSYCACLKFQQQECPKLAEPENPANGGCP